MRELWSKRLDAQRRAHDRREFSLTKNLRVHWLEGARWFWDTLVDADLANNTLGCSGWPAPVSMRRRTAGSSTR